MYKHPGVYIEHVPSGLLAIEAAATSIAAFIGPAKRGPIGEPVFISGAGQYEDQFGVLGAGLGGIRNNGSSPDRFGHAINAFFANGGSKAYVLRVVENSAGNLSKASIAIPNPVDAARGFTVTAANEGVWGNALQVRLRATDPSATPDLTLGFTLQVGIEQDGAFVALETFTGLSMNSASGQFIEKVIEDSSTLIDIAGAVIGGGAGQIPTVTANGLRGAPMVFTDGKLNIAGTTALPGQIDVVIGGGTPIPVTFTANTADLKALAAHIQATVRAASPTTPDFTVTIEVDGTNRRLNLVSGLLGAAGSVATPAPGGGTNVRPALGLNTTTTLAFPPTSLATGGQIIGWLSGGGDGQAAPDVSFYNAAYTTLRDYRDVSILLLPDQNWLEGGDNSIIQNAVTHCEFMKNRMVVVDPPDTTSNANKIVTPKDVKDLGAPTSPYTALYYPWLEVTNPHYDPDTAANLPKTFAVPPSAFAAGMWSRIDGTRGVWKAPAGLEATVRGAIGPNVLIGNDLQDNLNEWGVNCLRSIIGPTVIWGARTLATKSKPEF
ncbi:phage tail sheath subtilisin-like domain-containing protein, partial [bacterium]|nr:phage tail sheath subtilisin-like domain-containing protein [bacterium]